VTAGLDHAVATAPFYLATGDEEAVFRAAVEQRLPVLLKGPTGCGKTRFVEYMAWQLARELTTVTCHDDMTAADLVGRYLLDQTGTSWLDGPLTRTVRAGLSPDRTSAAT
jgi:nitric oxide reductase NorQ protein